MVEYLAPTKRRAMTKARATRIFLSRNGECFVCRQQIRQGDGWIVEHPDPVAQGGSDDDADLWPAHEKCRRVKDKKDAADKAKRDRLVTASWAGKSKSRPMPGSKASGWRKRLDGTVERRESHEREA